MLRPFRKAAAAPLHEAQLLVIGKTYLERGEPVICRARWTTGIGKVIKNVLIERADGTLVVRPFRGLRLPV